MSDHEWLARWRVNLPGGHRLDSVYICNGKGRTLLEAIANVAIDVGTYGVSNTIVCCAYEFFATSGAGFNDLDEHGLAHVSGVDPVKCLAGDFAEARDKGTATDWHTWLVDQGADGVLLALGLMVPDFDDELDEAEGA